MKHKDIICFLSFLICIQSFSQNDCNVSILVRYKYKPVFVLYDNGKIIYKAEKSSDTYYIDSLDQELYKKFIDSLNLNKQYYRQKRNIKVGNRFCSDCGSKLDIHTNIKQKKKSNLIIDYSEKKNENIPKSIYRIYNKTFYYKSLTQIRYNPLKIRIRMSIDNNPDSIHTEKWSFNWMEYKKTNCNVENPDYPILIVDEKYFNEINFKKDKCYIEMDGLKYYIFSVEPVLPNEDCFNKFIEKIY